MDANDPSPSPVHLPERSADLTLAALVGREFVEVLDAGLRRARTTGRRPAQPPSLPPAESRTAVPRWQRTPEPGPDPAVALLSRHAPAILRSFEGALAAQGRAEQTPRRAPRRGLLAWAQNVLRRAMRLAPATAAPPPTAEQQVFAAALLLECAAMTLPTGHPAGTEALGALARAIRTSRTATVPASSAAAATRSGETPGRHTPVPGPVPKPVSVPVPVFGPVRRP
ncbi:hypothetical protein [Streptomyces acidicola]|uniref:hypothetical protein n=1 Tax=Streptomyces acidicola TaxID=2596892 RepID=UPI00341DB41D